MYINSVLSYLGAWQTLQNDPFSVLSDIRHTLTSINVSPSQGTLSRQNISESLKQKLSEFGWEQDISIPVGRRNVNRSIDFAKDKVGLDFSFLRYQYILSDIFVKYPLFIRARKVELAVILVPTGKFGYSFDTKLGDYKGIRDQLTALPDIPVQYPFAVLGVSNSPSEIYVEELTTKLDQFLMKTIGLSLTEMRLSTEKERYDFKEIPPSDNRKIFHLACAIANQSGGGVILFGVDNSGNIKGILRSELDLLKQRITNTIRTNCQPQPNLNQLEFDVPFDPNKCVLVVHIQELEQKLCMTENMVYIRVGSEARPAKSEEIRRLLFR